MLVKPTNAELECLARLSQPGFQPLMDFLARELAACHEHLVKLEDANKLARTQGRAAFLNEFSDLVQKAWDLI